MYFWVMLLKQKKKLVGNLLLHLRYLYKIIILYSHANYQLNILCLINKIMF